MKKIICFVFALSILLTFTACETTSKSNNNDRNNSAAIIKDEILKETMPKYTVNFETNGGTYISSIKTYMLDEAPITSKEGYLFDGWFYDATFTNGVTFPIELKSNVTIYARWLKIESKTTCSSTSIKFLSEINSNATYNISPNGFDMDRLEQLGYGIKIEVTYDVYYKKDYDYRK